MMASLTLAEINDLTGGKLGTFDLPCPECGPGSKSVSGRKKAVMRIWWTEPGFARFNCQRCGFKGWARDDASTTATDRARWSKTKTEADKRDSEAAAQRVARAMDLWTASRPPQGTLAETYLAGRGLALPAGADALRFHPACPFRLADGTSARLPAIVALMRDIRTDQPCGIHRTALKPDGSGKADVQGWATPKRCSAGPRARPSSYHMTRK